jgi:hypothetical protein
MRAFERKNGPRSRVHSRRNFSGCTHRCRTASCRWCVFPTFFFCPAVRVTELKETALVGLEIGSGVVFGSRLRVVTRDSSMISTEANLGSCVDRGVYARFESLKHEIAFVDFPLSRLCLRLQPRRGFADLRLGLARGQRDRAIAQLDVTVAAALSLGAGGRDPSLLSEGIGRSRRSVHRVARCRRSADVAFPPAQQCRCARRRGHGQASASTFAARLRAHWAHRENTSASARARLTRAAPLGM